MGKVKNKEKKYDPDFDKANAIFKYIKKKLANEPFSTGISIRIHLINLLTSKMGKHFKKENRFL